MKMFDDDLKARLERMRDQQMESQGDADLVTPSCQCHGVGFIFTQEAGNWKVALCVCVTRCQDCGGDGHIPKDENGYDVLYPCSTCTSKRKMARAFNRACLPGKHSPRKSKPLSPEQGELFKVMRAWVKRYQPRCPGFTLSGDAGVGKSYTVAAVLRDLAITYQVHGRYIDVRELFGEMRSHMDQKGESPDKDVSRMVQAEVLVLDEMPGLFESDWQCGVITDILQQRYKAERTTILTTNHDEAGLIELFGGGVWGERVPSRLVEMSPIITVGGPDLRRRKK